MDMLTTEDRLEFARRNLASARTALEESNGPEDRGEALYLLGCVASTLDDLLSA